MATKTKTRPTQTVVSNGRDGEYGSDKPKKYIASIYPAKYNPEKGEPIPPEFVQTVQALEQALGLPVWLLIQQGDEKKEYDTLDDDIVEAFFEARSELPLEKPIALLIDSPGGYAESAYQLATLLRKHCGGFVALIPRYAKSAATLLALGAEEIIFGEYAQLGPLDTLFYDPDRITYDSALNEVQALEGLRDFGIVAIYQTMDFLHAKTAKKIDTLLPEAQHFVSDMMRPLFEKMDTVRYTQKLRALREVMEYAFRLLKPKYSDEEAGRIAQHLVQGYPGHGFIIDAREAESFGLKLKAPNAAQAKIMNDLIPYLYGKVPTIIGRLKEVGE